jgi:hypothetical protein
MRTAIALALLAACKPTPGGFSCWTGNVCEDYGSDFAAHETACKAITGEWEKHACPSDNLVGTCLTDQHQPRMYYGGATNAYTSDTASASCEHEFHGTWTSATK